MTVRELVGRINPHNVPVFYHNNKEQKQLFYTRLLTADELGRFRNRIVEDLPVGIYLLDTSIEEAFKLLSDRNAFEIKMIIEMIRLHYKMPATTDMRYPTILYTVMHEMGHWDHFLRTELSGVDYWQKYGVPEDNLMKKYYCHCLMNPDNYEIIQRRYSQQYRRLPMEAEADSYALREMAPFMGL